MDDVDEWINSMPLVADTIDPDSEVHQALLAIAEETPPKERAESFKDSGNLAYILGTKGPDAAHIIEEKKLRDRGIDPHAPVPAGLDANTKPTPLNPDDNNNNNHENHGNITMKPGGIYDKDIGKRRLGRQRIHDAIAYYTQALAMKCDDNVLNAVIYCNRGMSHYQLKNYGHCVRDCVQAIKLNDKHMKAYYHASRACIKVEKLEFAKKFITNALKLKASMTPIMFKLMMKQERIVDDCIEKEREKTKRMEEKRVVKNQESRSLVDEFMIRGVEIKKLARNNELPGDARVYCDDVGVLHYPVLIMYPQYRASDLIQNVAEDSVIYDHLLTILSETSYADWDIKHEYIMNNIEIYVEVGKSSSGHDKMKLINSKSPLHTILTTPGFIIDGIPTVYIVAKSNEFYKKFKENHKFV